MRYQLKRMLSTTLAVALLGFTVMLSVSAAKGPYRHAGENAFDGPPLGHPEKALISTAWIDDHNAESFVTDAQAFDWGLEYIHGCPQCGFRDAHVMPVVLDMPELLGGSDEAAVDVIKRKLGINPFRGSIFEGPESPTAQLQKQNAPAELKAFDCVLERLSSAVTATHGATSLTSQAPVCTTGPVVGTDSSAAACKTNNLTAESAYSDSAPEFLTNAAEMAARNSGRLDLLRQVSPGLDELANQLEDADLFAEADAIREAAQRLRIRARELKTGATAAAAPAPWKPVSTIKATSECCQSQCGGACGGSKNGPSDDESSSLARPIGGVRKLE